MEDYGIYLLMLAILAVAWALIGDVRAGRISVLVAVLAVVCGPIGIGIWLWERRKTVSR